MTALLIIAHGSPRPEANEDIRKIAQLIRERGRWDLVAIGYLDCNAPDIATAIDECVAGGVTELAVVPYFLHTGKHLLRDIPDALKLAAGRHRSLTITLGSHLGRQPEIIQVLRDRYLAAKMR